MSGTWLEVEQALKENRHELVLHGAEISEKIGKNGIDLKLFDIQSLNFLNITHTCLKKVPDELGNLKNLTNLVLHSNEIDELPITISKLTKLKVLDCSRNKIEELPKEFEDLPQLMSLNLGMNLLCHLPLQKANLKLSILDLSHNKFQEFPDICYSELIHLAELRLNDNRIKEINPNINLLSALKFLDLGNNQITAIPGELADCQKIKDLNLKGNKLSDKRLLKLVDQCHTKQIMDYIRQHCPKLGESTNNHTSSKSKKGKKNRKNSESDNVNNILEQNIHKLHILKVSDNVPVIKITDEVKKVRPHIVACVIKNLSFTEETFKKFIQLQTRLHDGICDKRNAATIATHDFDSLVPGSLTYTALPPQSIKIKPLMRTQIFTASELFQQLQTEADNLRKEKKRNVYTGIHKYLYLLEGKAVYPCLLDSSNQVISFPPITNSDITKMSKDTKNMFVEVTSSTSLQTAKQVLDEFLRMLVIEGLGCVDDNNDKKYHELLVEQVKIVDWEGNLKSVYPSRSDAVYERKDIAVIREP